MKNLIYILIVFTLFSCKKQGSIQIPAEEAELVVNSNFCLDSFISFNLSYTQSITNNAAPITELNANIELYDKDTNLLETLTHKGNGNYFSLITIAMASRKYLTKITTPKNIYWASDSIPAKALGILTSADSINFHNNPYFFRLKYLLNDNHIYQNYYGFKLKHLYKELHPNDTILKEEWLDIETIDPVLIEDINSRFSKKQLLFTDKFFNNSSITLELGTSKIINTSEYKTSYLILYLEQYSFDAYLYYSSINEHIFYQNDPFSQPINVKGNIRGGAYGAFIGKSIKADTMTFKF